jgi:hypothetical protein
MPETSQLPPVSQPAREKSRYPIRKVWIPHPSRVRSVLLIRPDDELSLAWPFPRSAQGGWLCLTCGRVACSDDFPNQHAGACPHRRWCSVRQRTAQPTCWLQSAPTPESLQSAASTTRCPHYRRLAITDEASPFALRSTRIRLRRALHQRCYVDPPWGMMLSVRAEPAGNWPAPSCASPQTARASASGSAAVHRCSLDCG